MHSAPMPSSSRQAGTASSDRCCWAGSPVGVEEAGVGHSWMTQWSPFRGGTDPTRLRREDPSRSRSPLPFFEAVPGTSGHPPNNAPGRQQSVCELLPRPPWVCWRRRGVPGEGGGQSTRSGGFTPRPAFWLAANTQTTERADNNSAPDPACPQPAVRVVRIAFIKINAAGTNYRL